MMKAGLAFGLSLTVALCGPTLLLADDKAEKSDAKEKCVVKCPVSGMEISKDASIDFKGAKLFFCCPGCIEKYKKEAAKYEAKANTQLVATGQFTQVACPLSGGKLNPATKTKVGDVEVCFCCGGCQGKVKKATAEKASEIVFLTGFDKAFKIKPEDKEKKDK